MSAIVVVVVVGIHMIDMKFNFNTVYILYQLQCIIMQSTSI